MNITDLLPSLQFSPAAERGINFSYLHAIENKDAFNNSVIDEFGSSTKAVAITKGAKALVEGITEHINDLQNESLRKFWIKESTSFYKLSARKDRNMIFTIERNDNPPMPYCCAQEASNSISIQDIHYGYAQVTEKALAFYLENVVPMLEQENSSKNEFLTESDVFKEQLKAMYEISQIPFGASRS